MPAMPANPQLYARIRAEVYKEMPTHSAYRSATLVRRYKESGGMYQGKKPTEGEGLRRWLKEDWRNQRGGVGYQKKRRRLQAYPARKCSDPYHFRRAHRRRGEEGTDRKSKQREG